MSTIAGEYTPEHGSIVVDGRSVAQEDLSTDHLFKRCNVSWCPQHDSLFPSLSVSQHLQFYARIRGLDWESEEAKDHVHAIIHLLGFCPHLEKLATELSGGYKRRLSLAIAMIGYPTSVLIDECTTGVDPSARHLIWGILQPDMVHETYDLPAILLSTHYMDEAAALASRIGIMIDGELVTTGSLYRLQERYCNSYFVEIALQQAAPSNSDDEIIGAFHSQGMDANIYESLAYTSSFCRDRWLS
jgi:ABC-type multidrug transport system ATPase subunit